MDVKQKIGVVAISYNEEVDLPGFIDHLKFWVDEIIIVDDGSTDETEKIASASGPKVKFLKSKRLQGQYYSDQRNKGIDASKSDWLLHMDIDERVTKEMSQEILKCIESKDYDAFKFRRLNYFFHRPMKGGGWADWNLVHLARRDVLRFGGMYHESIQLKVINERIGQLKNKMHHFNDDSYSERLKKSITYQEEVLLKLEERKINVRLTNMLFAIVREFLVKYFIKMGYLDGIPGFISAFHSSFSTFKVYALLWEKQNKIERSELEQEIVNNWR